MPQKKRGLSTSDSEDDSGPPRRPKAKPKKKPSPSSAGPKKDVPGVRARPTNNQLL